MYVCNLGSFDISANWNMVIAWYDLVFFWKLYYSQIWSSSIASLNSYSKRNTVLFSASKSVTTSSSAIKSTSILLYQMNDSIFWSADAKSLYCARACSGIEPPEYHQIVFIHIHKQTSNVILFFISLYY